MEQFLFKLQNKQAFKSTILNNNIITFSRQIQKKIWKKDKTYYSRSKGVEGRNKREKE